MNLNDWNWNDVQRKIDDFNRSVFGLKLKKQYTLEFKDFFDISLEECIERDSKRENPIGEKVITETYNKYKDTIEKLKKSWNLIYQRD